MMTKWAGKLTPRAIEWPQTTHDSVLREYEASPTEGAGRYQKRQEAAKEELLDKASIVHTQSGVVKSYSSAEYF